MVLSPAERTLKRDLLLERLRAAIRTGRFDAKLSRSGPDALDPKTLLGVLPLQNEWGKLLGPLDDQAGAAELIGYEPTKLRDLMMSRDVIVVDGLDSTPLIPLEQFGPQRRLLPLCREILDILDPEGAISDFTFMDLLRPASDLAGRRPLDLLHTGDGDQVLAWARSRATQTAVTPPTASSANSILTSLDGTDLGIRLVKVDGQPSSVDIPPLNPRRQAGRFLAELRLELATGFYDRGLEKVGDFDLLATSLLEEVDDDDSLAQTVGRLETIEAVAAELGCSVAEVTGWVLAREMIAMDVRVHGVVLPAWQFDGEEPLMAEIRAVNLVVDPTMDDPWGTSAWLRSRSVCTGGDTLIEALSEGGVDAVLEHAQQSVTEWKLVTD